MYYYSVKTPPWVGGVCESFMRGKMVVGFGVQGSGLARGAGRPLITCERGSAGLTGSEGSMGVVRRIKI